LLNFVAAAMNDGFDTFWGWPASTVSDIKKFADVDNRVNESMLNAPNIARQSRGGL